MAGWSASCVEGMARPRLACATRWQAKSGPVCFVCRPSLADRKQKASIPYLIRSEVESEDYVHKLLESVYWSTRRAKPVIVLMGQSYGQTIP